MNLTVVAQFYLTMGKKNKKAKSVTAETDSGMPRHVRREVLEIVNQLLDSGYLGFYLAVACTFCYIILIGPVVI